MKQFVQKVVNYSSQYGTAGTSSYVADNLAGDLKVGDKYGDYTEAFVLRTYGTWWQRCPSAQRKLCKAVSSFKSEDFVELQYEVAVVPTAIVIYETYHPGSVVRILACNTDPKENSKPGEVEWVILWSGPPQCSQLPHKVRQFKPPLKNITFATNLIRLEFNSIDCGYYTELDGVELIGNPPSYVQKFKDRAAGFQVALTTRLIRQLSLSDRQTSIGSEDLEFEKWGYFGLLPDEIIQNIFQYLDIVSLANVAQTSSLLLKNAYDPLLYAEVDLKSCWNIIDDVSLEGLTSRCSNLCHLDLSWTGAGGQVTEDALCRFLSECGSELVTLRLACCKYVHNNTMIVITQTCKKLEELDLQSCLHLGNEELLHIKELVNLKRLNLYCMNITSEILQSIGMCTELEHLNLGASTTKGAFHETKELSNNLCKLLAKLKKLISLDLWRCKFADRNTLDTLSNNCADLQEIDVGWCHTIMRNTFTLENFCSSCRKLKKIFFTCGRSLADHNMKEIAKYCTELEQIDILGTNHVTRDGALAVLKACPKLHFFDLSFCGQLTAEIVQELGITYPNVCFKKSYQ